MVNQAYPVLNDIEPSWADVEVTATLNGGSILNMADLSALKWDRKVTVGYKKGLSGGRKMARTTGEVEYSASMSIYLAALYTLERTMMSLAPQRGNQRLISLVTFDVLIQRTPPGSSDIYTTKWKGCRLLGDAFDLKEGVDAESAELTVDVMEIVNIIDGNEVVLL